MSTLHQDLQTALSAAEASFHVRLIATFDPDLVWAPADASASSWLAQNNPTFDQFPVKDGIEAVGLLMRNGAHDGKTVRDSMRPLRDGLIVAADTPIAELIPDMERQHCFLVLRRGRIDGLVTQSDLVKLPVRMLLFGLMSHLELCLRALVAQRAPYPAWLDRLSGESRRRVEGEFKRAALARLDPDPLEFTTFSDVVALLKRERDLAANFLDEMETIRQFRNDIAHAKSYVQSAEDVPRIVSTFASIRKWIESLSNSVRIVR